MSGRKTISPPSKGGDQGVVMLKYNCGEGGIRTLGRDLTPTLA